MFLLIFSRKIFIFVKRLKSHLYLEILINLIEAFGIFRQLLPDVLRPDEDGLEMGPRPLNLKPDTDHLVCCGQFLLPRGHLFQEVGNVLLMLTCSAVEPVRMKHNM